jgi:hypothetical protein
MSANNLQERILLLAVEDYSGLWEAAFEAKALNTELSDSQAITLADDIIRQLLKQGWIKLFWSNWPSFDYTTVADSQTDEVLANSLYWKTPSTDAKFIRYSATDEGEKASLKELGLQVGYLEDKDE